MQRGDVLLVDYPYSDRTGSKVRPCLVVQNNQNNARLNNTIVVTITTNARRASIEPTPLLIDVATPTGQQSGLLHTSAIQCENILTIDRQFIMHNIGNLPPDAMAEIDECLKASLGIVT